MEKNYQWKMASFAKKVDPEQAMDEIRKAENLYGKITAETVLQVAKDNKSPLHKLFEWDDSKAAEKYRMAQARTLVNNIEVKIISDGEERSIPVYEIVNIKPGEDNDDLSTAEGRQYKHINTLTYDEVAQVKEATIRAINSLKFKLSAYRQFDKVVKHLDMAVDELI